MDEGKLARQLKKRSRGALEQAIEVAARRGRRALHHSKNGGSVKKYRASFRFAATSLPEGGI